MAVKTAVFTLPAAVRIVNGIHRVERSYYNTASMRARYPLGSGGGNLSRVTSPTGGISAGGSGTVTLNGASVTVHNPYTKAVPASVVMWMAWNAVTNQWEVVDWDC